MRTVCFLGGMGLMDISPIRLSERAGVGGDCTLNGSLNRVLDVQTKPFIPQGKARSYKFPPDFYVAMSERGIMEIVCLSLSYLF